MHNSHLLMYPYDKYNNISSPFMCLCLNIFVLIQFKASWSLFHIHSSPFRPSLLISNSFLTTFNTFPVPLNTSPSLLKDSPSPFDTSQSPFIAYPSTLTPFCHPLMPLHQPLLFHHYLLMHPHHTLTISLYPS